MTTKNDFQIYLFWSIRSYIIDGIIVIVNRKYQRNQFMESNNCFNIRSTSLILLLLCTFSLFVQGQNTRIDSLKWKLHNQEIDVATRMSMVSEIARTSLIVEDKLDFADQLLSLGKANSELRYVVRAYLSKGTAYRLKGELKNSLEQLFLAAENALESQEYELLIESYSELSITYTANQEFRTAIQYNKRSIELLRQYGNEKQLAINLLNTGYSYYTLNELDSALMLYEEAEPIFSRLNIKIGTAYTFGNRGLVYWKRGQYSESEEQLLKALSILESVGNHYALADFNNQLASVYLEQNKIEESIAHTNRGLELAKSLDLKEQIRDAYFLLSKLYTRQNDFSQALDAQSNYYSFKDSLENIEQVRNMADLRTDFEVNVREKEIALLQNQKALQNTYFAVTVILLFLALTILLFFRQRFINTKLLATNERMLHAEQIKDLLRQKESEALQSIIIGRDNERKRIAEEVHNHLGSLLATIKVNINSIDDESSGQYRTISTLIDQACEDVRNMSHSLNMGISPDFGLVPALQDLVDHIERSRGLEIEFGAAMQDSELDPEFEILVYRIIQELVSNVLKHANATQLSILLTFYEEDQILNILVNDNGKGFDEEKSSHSKGMGIPSLRRMVNSRNGEISFDSNASSGTTVIIDLPISISQKIVDYD